MGKNEKLLFWMWLVLLCWIIVIPFTTNALSGSNVNSGSVYSGNIWTGNYSSWSTSTWKNTTNTLSGSNVNSGPINNLAQYDRIDLNEDWQVNIADQTRFYNKCRKAIMGQVSLNASETKKCDLNGDWVIDISDEVGFNNEFNEKVMWRSTKSDSTNYGSGTLTNNLKKTVEFNASEVNRKVVFDGTYTALNNNSINGVSIELENGDIDDPYESDCYNEIKFDLYIDWKEIKFDNGGNFLWNSCWGTNYRQFNQSINLNQWESIKVNIIWQSYNAHFENKKGNYTYKLTFKNNDWKELASANLAPIKIIKNTEILTGSIINTWYVLTGSVPNTGNIAKLTNNLKKTVEFKANEVSKKIVFNGTLTALKNTSIHWFSVENNGKDENICYNDVIFYTYINWKEVETNYWNAVMNSCWWTHYIRLNKDINVQTWGSINIKIEWELNSTLFGNNNKWATYSTKLNFYGKKWANDILASANLVPIKIVENINKFSIQTPSQQDTVYLKGNNSTLAEFTLKPSTWNNEYLNELVLEIDKPWLNKSDDIRLIIDGNECDLVSWNDWYNLKITCQPDTEISSKWAQVKVVLKNELEYDNYTIITNLKSINWESINKSFSKRFVSALAYIKKQENKWNYTEFTIWVDKYDDNYSIETLYMLTWSTGAGTSILGEYSDNWPFEDWYTFTVSNTNSVQPINYISYVIKNSERVWWADSISIKREDYPDYFKVNWDDRKIYGNKIAQNEENKDKWQNKYSSEMVEAYEFAYKNWITSANSIEKARMNSPLSRIEMAKMLSNYAINVLWKTPDFSKWVLEYKDVTKKQNSKYDNAVTLAYQLWIMWENIKNFRPNDVVRRAEFATALSRMLYNTEDWTWNAKYYEPHIEKLYNEWIINKKDPKIIEKRWYVMLMLMRAAQ